MSGAERAEALLRAKQKANRALYANMPAPTDSRQVRRYATRKANKAASRRMRGRS